MKPLRDRLTYIGTVCTVHEANEISRVDFFSKKVHKKENFKIQPLNDAAESL